MTWHRTWCALCDAVAGNPLALLELPGVLDADQRAGRRPLDDPLSVTASVERAFLTRIDRLDADGREALLLAAASDSDDVETVRRAAPAAATGLAHAERIGLVRVQRGRIVFWHPLGRSAVYAAATDEERGAARRALADGLSQAHPARRAWHLVAADGGNDRWATAEAQAALGLLELGLGEDGAARTASGYSRWPPHDQVRW